MAFSAMIDALFNDPLIAQDATYTPGGGGGGQAVRVILRQPDMAVSAFGTSVVVESTMVEVRVSQVAAPEVGGQFDIGGAVYVVSAAPKRDNTRLVWVCEARPQ